MSNPLLIVEPQPRSGAWNMAADEALLEAAIERGLSVFRWFRWEVPTLSLGYFQAADDPAVNGRFAALAKVRRLSGGGAILHHCEWTYSCTLPPTHPLADRATELYARVHTAVIEALAEFGITAAMRGEQIAHAEGRFLCFLRGDPRDVVCGAQKILGSAQRRRRGAVLQHGSLVLHTSEHAPEIPGLAELTGHRPDERELLAAINARIPAAMGWDITSPGEVQPTMALPEPVAARAAELARDRYATLDWHRRGPATDG
jgi:lipoate-protein ligase A